MPRAYRSFLFMQNEPLITCKPPSNTFFFLNTDSSDYLLKEIRGNCGEISFCSPSCRVA